jgi:phosphonate transport system permease protein
MLLVVLRGLPELVWALLFVRVFGLGPAAGVLALGLTYGGMLAKVYAEILESGDSRPARALLEAGSSRLQALCYGLLPGAAQELTSYTVYRWECAVRASVVMGFVGAGGLGQLMDQSMRMLNGGEAATILLTFLLLVLAADALSGLLRRQLGEADGRAGALAFGARTLLWLLLLGSAVAASYAWLDLGFAALLTGAGAGVDGRLLRRLLPARSFAWLVGESGLGITGDGGHFRSRDAARRGGWPAAGLAGVGALRAGLRAADALSAQRAALGAGIGVGDA